MEYNQKILTNQYLVVSHLLCHFAYYKGLSAVQGRINNHGSFWAVTIFGHRELGTIEWCKVFGSQKEDLHWTKTPTGNAAEQAKDDFRRRVLSKTGFSEEQWKAYHQKILTFRNEFLVHLDMDGVLQSGIPPFEPAVQVAYAYEEWSKIIEPALKERGSFRSLYEGWRAEASSVASLYLDR